MAPPPGHPDHRPSGALQQVSTACIHSRCEVMALARALDPGLRREDSGGERVDQRRAWYAAGGAWQGRFVGRLGRAGVGAASDLRERSLFEPLIRGKCLSGTFRCSEGYRERPCPPRTSEAGASVSEVEADPG